MKTFGERLKFCRKRKGYTQEDVALAIGMSSNQLSELENDKYLTSTFTVKLARHYGVNPFWLEEGVGEMEMDSITIEIANIYDKLDDKFKAILLEQARLLEKMQK